MNDNHTVVVTLLAKELLKNLLIRFVEVKIISAGDARLIISDTEVSLRTNPIFNIVDYQKSLQELLKELRDISIILDSK